MASCARIVKYVTPQIPEALGPGYQYCTGDYPRKLKSDCRGACPSAESAACSAVWASVRLLIAAVMSVSRTALSCCCRLVNCDAASFEARCSHVCELPTEASCAETPV